MSEEFPDDGTKKDTFKFKTRKVPYWEIPEEYAKVVANPTRYKKEEPKENKEPQGLDAFLAG